MPSRGPPPGIRVGRLCHRPLMARPHQLRALLRRLQSGAHGPRLMTQASSSSPTISVAVAAAVSGAYYAICIHSVGFTSHGLHCLDTTYAGFSPPLLLMRVLSPFQVVSYEGSFPFSAAVSGAYYAICMRSVGVASHGLRCLDTTYAGFSPLLLLMRVLSPFA